MIRTGGCWDPGWPVGGTGTAVRFIVIYRRGGGTSPPGAGTVPPPGDGSLLRTCWFPAVSLEGSVTSCSFTGLKAKSLPSPVAGCNWASSLAPNTEIPYGEFFCSLSLQSGDLCCEDFMKKESNVPYSSEVSGVAQSLWSLWRVLHRAATLNSPFLVGL